MMKGIWFDNIHSYDNLNLILSSVSIPPATVKTNYIDIPGADGSLDLTEALGAVRYKTRSCSFVFSVFPYEDFEEKKKQISNLLNGRRCKILLDKDPAYYWLGRCSVNNYASDRNLHKITVNATVDPYKYKLDGTIVDVELCGDECHSRATGNPLFINDLSAVVQPVDLKVGGLTRKSNNLIPYPYFDNTKTINGITFTVNGNNTITANGTATAQTLFWLVQSKDIGVKEGETYTLSCCPSGGSDLAYLVEVSCGGVYPQDRGNGISFTAKSNTISIYIVIRNGVTVNNLVFKPMLNEGSTALPYEIHFEGLRSAPVTAVESIGKNRLQFPETFSALGIKMTRNEKGEYVFNGTSTGNALLLVPIELPRGYYTISFNNEIGIGSSTSDSPYFAFRLPTTEGSGWFTSGTLKTPNTIARISPDNSKFDTGNIADMIFNVPSGVTLNNFVIKPQLETGTEATPYTPYVSDIVPIPDSIKALDGYGDGINVDCYNHIDWKKKQFVKQVGKVDLGALNWSLLNSTTWDAVAPKNMECLGNAVVPILLSEKYSITYANVVGAKTNSISLANDTSTTVAPALYIRCNNGSTTEKPSGKMVYKLATPEVTDISSSLPNISLAIDHITNADGEAVGVTNIYAITDESTNNGAILDLTYFNKEYKPKTVVLNNSKKPVVPIVECSDDNTTIEFDSSVVIVNAGKHKILDLQLKEGENSISITGLGTAKFTYQEGDL
jgi:phage-related protein